MVVSVKTETQRNHVPFSRTLRTSTREAHENAHRSRYMTALLNGVLPLSGYTKLAVQYFFIYQAIERASDTMATDPVGRFFVVDALRRMPAITRDVEFLLAPHNNPDNIVLEPLPATAAYVNRINAVAHSWAGHYVAHHYTRYLGDIAGGQVIRRLLNKKYDLDDPGASFYHFDDLGSAPAFRDRYRGMLDSAPWSEQEREDVINEARVAFGHNIAIFDELADELLPVGWSQSAG